MKTIRALASEISKREGKKSQARIGEIREVLAILSDMVYDLDAIERHSLECLLWENGRKRAKRKKK